MIVREARERPLIWPERRKQIPSWSVPFFAVEWVWEWTAFLLSRWTFVVVLEYLEIQPDLRGLSDAIDQVSDLIELRALLFHGLQIECAGEDDGHGSSGRGLVEFGQLSKNANAADVAVVDIIPKLLLKAASAMFESLNGGGDGKENS